MRADNTTLVLSTIRRQERPANLASPALCSLVFGDPFLGTAECTDMLDAVMMSSSRRIRR